MSGSGSGSGSGTSRHNERAKAAILLARLGWRVFPLGYRRKLPFGKDKMGLGLEERGGFYCGTTDEKKIIAWATSHTFQNCNWGCWPDDLTVVIDVDLLDDGSPNPNIPQEVAYELAKAGAITITPSGGRHYWFRQPEPNRWRGINGATKDKTALPSHIDIKTSTGLVVLPPSEVARKHGSGFGEYAWAPDYELTVSPAELPVTPPAVAEWLDSILGVTPESERVPSGDPKPIVISDPIPGFTEGSVEDYISSSTHWQKAALDLFIESEGVTKQWSSGEVIYFQRPGSKHPFGALWNAPGGRHGASGDAIRPLYYPRLGIGSSNWLRLSNTRDGKRAKNSFRAYSAAEIIRAYTPAAEMPELEKRWRKEHITQRRMKQVEEAGREWVADMAEWSEILWEGWLVEHHPHVRDCERIANELDGDMAVYEEEETAEPKTMAQEQDQPTATPGQEATAKANEAGTGADSVPPVTPARNREATGNMVGHYDFGSCAEIARMAEDLTPEELMEVVRSSVAPEGVIARTIGTLDSLAKHKQPLFNIAAGLMNMSVAVGPSLQGPTGLMGNIYMIGTTNSAMGKDMPLRMVEQVEQMACLDDPTAHGCSPRSRIVDIPHSASALLTGLRNCRTKGLVVDEIGTWLKIANTGSPSANQATLMRLLTKLYSAKRGPYAVSEYAKEEDQARSKSIDTTPFVTMLAMSQPRLFFENLTPTDLDSGLLGRLLVFQGNERVRAPRGTPYRSLDDHHIRPLVPLVKAWKSWGAEGCDFVGLHDNIDAEHYLALRAGPGVAEGQTDFADGCEDAYHAILDKGCCSGLLLTRIAENAGRIAVLLAADSMGDPAGYSQSNRPIITRQQMDLGLLIAAYTTFRYRVSLRGSLAASSETRWHMRFREWILSQLDGKFKQGVPLSTFTKRFDDVDISTRAKFLGGTSLAMHGLGITKALSTGGRTKTLITRS